MVDCSLQDTLGDQIAYDMCDNEFAQSSIGFFMGLFSLVLAACLAKNVLGHSSGARYQTELAEIIHAGAKSFLHTEYKFLAIFVFFMAVGVGLTVSLVEDNVWGVYTAINLVVGASMSALAGYIGMYIATRANVRTTEACKVGLNEGLRVAFRSGAVMAFTVVGLGLTGLSVMFMAFHDEDFENLWGILSGFGFGASSIALFARVGGGVYTKAADVGADLVGKVESDIPEDSPRNPAVIADNVGDNVGDVAGMGADLFESYVGSIIAAATLATSANLDYGGTSDLFGVANNQGGAVWMHNMVAFSFWMAGFGVIASVVGILFVRTSNSEDPPSPPSKQHPNYEQEMANYKAEMQQRDMEQLHKLLASIRRGVAVAGFLVVALTPIPAYVLFPGEEFATRLWVTVVVGLIAGVIIGFFTEYCTSYSYYPTQSIAQKTEINEANVVIQGLGVGMLSTAVPTITLGVAVLVANELTGLYGIAISAVGMLSTLGVTLATDAYGPVADNAGGIAEMCAADSGCPADQVVPDNVRDRTDALDALGNTTAATGKGFAIGSAVLTAAGLIAAFRSSANITTGVDLNSPPVLVGLLIGAMLPFVFAALTMLSVGKSAELIVLEVRAQFYERPEILYGDFALQENRPDYKRCIAISTDAAIQEMMMPGLLAIFSPLVVGLILGAPALVGLLVGALSSGFMLAITMANAGGAWDNAKKYIEKEMLGPGKGKRTRFHKAAVVGDTIGDPFKDTSGPSLNILIKLMSVISLMLAPLFRDASPEEYTTDGTVAGSIVLVVAVLLAYFLIHFISRANARFLDDVQAKKERFGNRSLKEVAAQKLGIPLSELDPSAVAERVRAAGATQVSGSASQVRHLTEEVRSLRAAGLDASAQEAALYNAVATLQRETADLANAAHDARLVEVAPVAAGAGAGVGVAAEDVEVKPMDDEAAEAKAEAAPGEEVAADVGKDAGAADEVEAFAPPATAAEEMPEDADAAAAAAAEADKED